MTVTKDDFEKIWASTSPLTPYSFSDAQYKEGWNFVGSTPPSRQMWDKYMNLADQKMRYLYNNYLPLAGGILSGYLQFNGLDSRIISSRADRDGAVSIYGGDGYTTGSYAAFYGINHDSNAGRFIIRAVTNGSKYKELQGRPDGTLTWDGQPLLPVGIVQAFAGTTIPNGWLLCDGSAVSRTTYAKLFSVIGTTYGSGNGSTTFNLPNLVDKFVEGSATAGTVKSAGLPNITGKLSKNGSSSGYFEIFEGAFTPENQSMRHAFMDDDSTYNLANGANFDASLSNPIYGKSTTVQPPALTMRYIIKY